MDAIKNFAIVTVSIGYDSLATSVVLGAGHGVRLPDPSIDGAFNLVWWNKTTYDSPADDPNVEICRCTGRSTDTLTLIRAQETTAATTKNTGNSTYNMVLALTAKVLTDIYTNPDVSGTLTVDTIDAHTLGAGVELEYINMGGGDISMPIAGKIKFKGPGSPYFENEQNPPGAHIVTAYALLTQIQGSSNCGWLLRTYGGLSVCEISGIGNMWLKNDVSIEGIIKADNILEYTIGAGVVVEGVEFKDGRISLGNCSDLIIGSGVITITSGFHNVDTESSTSTDDLDTINGGQTGDVLVLIGKTPVRTIIVKDSTGNIRANGDFTMVAYSSITLIKKGTLWVEMSRSTN